MVKIKEVFSSIQGEGLFVGEKQTFVRFSKCNLNCAYCDTDFKSATKDFDCNSLMNEISKYNCKTISLTGGEPLLELDFLQTFLPQAKEKGYKIYLETNGTLYENLEKIVNFVDVIAMDIKLKSATGQENSFFDNEKFLSVAKNKTFVKIVFDENIKDDEITNVLKIAGDTPIILQPKMPINSSFCTVNVFEKFYRQNDKVRMIPQMHKFLNLR